jgi:hypothetical protein
MENKTYLCWETDKRLEPTGNTKILRAPSARWAADHLKYTMKGQFKYNTNRCTIISLPDGKEWHVRCYK